MKIIDALTTSQAYSLILAIALLGACAVLFGKLFERIGLPNVVGEISAGLLLGPTVLGALSDSAYSYLFFDFDGEGQVINAFYHVGLIMLMFSTGLEMNLKIKRENAKAVGVLLIGSSLIPFGIGFGLSRFFIADYMGGGADTAAFSLIFGLAAAVTSIPVISKIFIDLGIIDTRFAGVMISAATLEDLIEWVVLSAALGMTQSSGLGSGSVIRTSLITVGVFVFSCFVMPRLAALGGGKMFGVLPPLVFCFLYVAALSLLGISMMYSALLAGLIVKKACPEQYSQAAQRIKSVSLSFFVPLYFAIVGLRVDIINNFAPMRFLAFFLLSTALEVGGIVVTLRFAKLRRDAIINFAFAMSARGGPGIVLATVGYEYGIINAEFFTTLILSSMLSSLIAGAWLRAQSGKSTAQFSKIYAAE